MTNDPLGSRDRAMSLDLMFGYTRLVSFGHAAAYGFGAYACGWMLLHTGMPLLFAVFAAGLLTGLLIASGGMPAALAQGSGSATLDAAKARGQMLCRPQDTVNGIIAKDRIVDSLLHITFQVVSDTGITSHIGNAKKI